jgi:DNA-binding response OmpR family regulator
MREEKIMIVDDEKDIVDFVRAYLEKEGYPTIEAYDGKSALDLWRACEPDLIVLDVLMPNLDGLEFCREVRRKSRVPIIILSAKSEEDDKLYGLDLGADDYMVKPFSPRELVARIKTILRRYKEGLKEAGVIVEGPLVIERESHQVMVNERDVTLTPMELNVLVALASHPGRVMTREELIKFAQGDYYDGYDRNIDNHVKNIRRKLKREASDWVFIDTVYGVGYRFKAKKRA